MSAPHKRAVAIAIGASHYFTGKPCPNGHVSLRKSSNGTCIDCQAARSKSWAANNPDKHREGAARRNKRWSSATRPQRREALQRWRMNNPAASAAQVLNRRAARKAAMPDDFGEFDAFVVEEAAAACKRRERMHGVKFHVDHIVPLARGGLHAWHNLQVIPAFLNVRKHTKLIFTKPGEWLRHV